MKKETSDERFSLWKSSHLKLENEKKKEDEEEWEIERERISKIKLMKENEKECMHKSQLKKHGVGSTLSITQACTIIILLYYSWPNSYNLSWNKVVTN